MAEKIVFKQQCPSCEAMVPIKDMKLVGRKIDCPKCKYRFVVEEPEKEEDDTEAEEQEAKNAKRPASGKGASDKAKPGKKRPRDDEDEDRPRKKGKKKSSGKDSSKLYLGLGLAVVAVVLLAVAGFFMLGGEKKRQPVGPLAGGGQNAGDDNTKKETPKTTQAAEASVVDVSNLLPNDSEMVLNVSVPDFLKSPLGETAFGTPGAFPPNAFKDSLGFSERDVDRYLLAANHTQDWLFHVVRLVQAADVDAVKKALRLIKPKDGPIQGQDYFITEQNWLENGSPLRPASPAVKPVANPPGSRPLAVCFLDGNKTLVLADLAPMKQFLASKGQPSLLTQPAAAPAPAAGAAPPAPATAPNGPPVASNSYLSIKPTLKAMLDRMEAGRPVVFSLANDMQADKGLLKPLAATLGVQGPLSELGLSTAQTKEAIVCAAGMECTTEEAAKSLNAQLQPRLQPLIALGVIVNIKVQIAGEQAPMGTPPPPPPPGGTGTPMPPTEGPAPAAEASATIRLTQSAKSVQLTAELMPNQNAMGILYPVLGHFWIDFKGQVDMALARPGIHTLALAGRGYADEKKQFPRGTFERIKKGINLPYPPDQRVSWMAELLPYLGHEDLHSSIDYQSSWRDTPNLNAAFTLIPEFLAPQSPSGMWRVRYPGLDAPVAATHFVGIAGVGLDAASNPAVANKLGIFGYDRITRMADIKDGASNTIFMIQVPPIYKSPWLAGGGSTVRGVPDSKSVQPFVCTDRDGKRGTYVLMADGSVRWVSDTISDDVFKAMCTINGGETLTNLDGLAPKIPAPAGQTTMRAQTTLPPAPPMKKP